MAPFNGDISAWNTSRVEDMFSMFGGSVFKGDISSWNVANVKEMSYMFYASEFDGDISAWNTSKVENRGWMFSNSKFNGDLSTWDFYHDVDINNFFDFEQMDQFEIPNLYHWYLLLNGSVTQNPQWREHIDAHATIVRSLTNTENEAAMLIHKAWLSQELECEATLAVPFESLEMP